MASTNIKIFDENKGNIMPDEAYAIDSQRVNGVQSGIASSQLQNKTLFQVSLMAYALAQVMNQNGIDANDYDAVSTFVNNLSNSLLQKVNDKASTAQAKAGTNNTKWMTPALVKEFADSWWSNLYETITIPTTKITGVLPLSKGGTGNSKIASDAGPNAILRKVSDGDYVGFTNTANGAFYATAANGLPKFGTLPVAQGGTGQTSVSNFLTQLASSGAARITSGTYTGNGTKTFTITFAVAPKIVVIAGGMAYRIFAYGSNANVFGDGSYALYTSFSVDWDSTTQVTITSVGETKYASRWENASGKTYTYYVIY